MTASAFQYIDSLQQLLQRALEKGEGLNHLGVAHLNRALSTAKALARETEEELLIADMRIAELLLQVKTAHRREPVDIDQEGNVIRLPFQPRIVRTVNPGGGDAA